MAYSPSKASSVSSSKLSSLNVKKKKLPPAPASVSFSQRFQSILFSLYNPQDRDQLVYDSLHPLPAGSVSASEKPKKYVEDYPDFSSPLCSFKVRNDIEEDGESRKKLLDAFHRRSAELVNELSLREYDQIKVSMVPFDVERTAEDRSVTERQHILEERIKEMQDYRSQASYRSREVAKKKKLEEDQISFSQRKLNNLENKRKMEESPRDYSSPSLAKQKIAKEEREKKQNEKKSPK